MRNLLKRLSIISGVTIFLTNRKAWDTKHLLRGLRIGMKETENLSRDNFNIDSYNLSQLDN